MQRLFSPLPEIPDDLPMPSLVQHAGTIEITTQLDRKAQRCPCGRLAYRHLNKRVKVIQCTNAACPTPSICLADSLYHCKARECYHRICARCHQSRPEVHHSDWSSLKNEFEPVHVLGQGQYGYKFHNPNLDQHTHHYLLCVSTITNRKRPRGM